VAQNGDVIGCVQLKPHTGCQELASLVVVQGWRNRGVAKALIEHVKENAGIPLYLMCDARLAPFYAKHGFEKLEERGEMPAYFRRIHLFTTLLIKTRLVKGQLAIMSWT
jgi:N-acetylglutamate synthase-like GNAT family acetyltransferase